MARRAPALGSASTSADSSTISRFRFTVPQPVPGLRPPYVSGWSGTTVTEQISSIT
ncbi:hypothetical protein ACFFX0_23315 [Citricoccus parietis]|uniref:Uncharacterized protein n=1 Tax=Citricoccus parietis TaxID=592307 RepID=A0ABV5G4V6_9MICC